MDKNMDNKINSWDSAKFNKKLDLIKKLNLIKKNNLKKESLNIGDTFKKVEKIDKFSVIPFNKKNKPNLLAYDFKHSGDCGDLIYSLPVVKYYGGGNIHLNVNGLTSTKYDGSESGFSLKLIKMLQPLLESQEYIKSANIWNLNKINFDLDYFRKQINVKQNLCESILHTFDVPFKETNEIWLKCNEKKIANVVIARSFRYRNKKINYKNILKDFKGCLFMGLQEEHKDFEDNFGKIDFHQVKDFLEMAEIIQGSELFIGNQSLPLSLAISMNKPIWQEYYPVHADCIFNKDTIRYLHVI